MMFYWNFVELMTLKLNIASKKRWDDFIQLFWTIKSVRYARVEPLDANFRSFFCVFIQMLRFN